MEAFLRGHFMICTWKNCRNYYAGVNFRNFLKTLGIN
jgi:hypothetical protein